MSKKPSRIFPKVENLSPESVEKVFSFINNFLVEQRLSVDYFKKEISNYNAGEQYLICKHCMIYFNNKGSDIFLYKWLETQREAYNRADEPEAYEALDEEITNNQKRLLNLLPFHEKINLKRFRDLIRFNIPINEYSNFHRDQPIDCRVPLFYGKSEFKEKFFEIWEELYTEDQIEEFFKNSFRFSNMDSKPKLLFLDIERRMLVSEQMLYTVNEYRESIKYQTRKVGEDFNEVLEHRSDFHRQFIKEFEDEDIIRNSFVKIMYNTFPEVRDKYKIKQLKSPGYSIDRYFENIAKNFSSERK